MADMMERYIHESSRAFYPAQGITSGQELIGMGTSYQGFSANGTYVSPVWSKIFLLFLSKKLQKIKTIALYQQKYHRKKLHQCHCDSIASTLVSVSSSWILSMLML